MTDAATEQALHFLSSSSGIVLAGILVLSLGQCLLGYALSRPLLVLYGLAAGIAVAAGIVRDFRPNPSTLDYVVAAGCSGVFLGVFCWIYPRIMFAGGVGLAAAIWLISITRTPAGIALAMLAGGLAALACFLFLRQAFIFLSAISGAILAGLAGLFLFVSDPQSILNSLQKGGASIGSVVFLLVALMLALLGMLCQEYLGNMFRLSISRRRRLTGGQIHPPFTRV